MLHVINEVTIDTCDIHQIKENAEVISNNMAFNPDGMWQYGGP